MVRIVKKPDERRKEIIKAARKLFREKSYADVTMAGLMKSLNIAKGTIYHYFASKEELLEAVVEDLMAEALEKKQALLKSSRCKEMGALEKFTALILSGSMVEENEEILESLHQPGNALMHNRLLGSFIIKLAPIYAGVIEEGCAEGVFKTEHPRECAEYLLAGFQFLTDIGFYPWGQDHLARRVQAFPALIETQLGAPKGSFSFLAGE